MARFYTVSETALILGFSTNSIYKFLDQHRLKATRGNSKQGRFRVPHTSIEDFLGTKLSETAVATALQASRRQKVSAPPRLVTATKAPEDRYRMAPEAHHIITHLEPLNPPPLHPAAAGTPLGLTTTRILILVVLVLTIIEVATTPVINLSSQLLRLLTLLIAILLAYQSGGSESR